MAALYNAEAYHAQERAVDERRRRELEGSVLYYAEHPDEIDARLMELDREWDVERVTEAELGLTALTFFGLGFLSRKWTLLGAVAAGFLGYHGLKGGSPVGLGYRSLGFRTMHEIERERFALKALRGDFSDLGVEAESATCEKAKRAMSAAY